MREQAFELANNIEEKWRQRSRCLWLTEGDRNTRFFHAMASSRHRRNLVLSIEDNGTIITDQLEIRQVFARSMQGVLGTTSQVTPFDATALYQSHMDLNSLQQPFTMIEIQAAVHQLANNKASGPDGLPNEFLKTYWNELKPEVYAIMQKFFSHQLDLRPYNEATIVMVPKTEIPVSTSDFRPISVLNLIPKLISKILSNRLRPVLSDLISINQTAFIQGRQILENFVTTRELLHHVSIRKTPAIFAKVDFKKAFDMIEWNFLESVMTARSFPARWISWIRHIWETSSSRLCINGECSEPFPHRRGLRQGDPLSPMLFDIAVDVFQQMIRVANLNLSCPLSRKISDAIVAYQYADDTAVIARADATTLITFKLILRLFSSVSGLQVNYNKSSFIPINIGQNELSETRAIMCFPQTDFPIQYLGMPLSIKRPTRDMYRQLIERVQSRLDTWQTKLISKGGRLQLVQSVLSSMTVYFMHCFLLPNWVIKKLDRARRSFMWGCSNRRERGVSLCNWQLVCLPKQWGGLGVPDLRLRNISLILRWWWKGYKERQSMWGSLIIKVRWQGVFTHGPTIWAKTGSFFWGQLHGVKHIFNMSVSWAIGDGTCISYWFDDWGKGALVPAGTRQINRSLSIRSASADAELLQGLAINFSDQPDVLTWKWSQTGLYTSKSIYAVLTGVGKIRWNFSHIWKSNTPPKVRIFIHLMLLGKILTKEVMDRRNFHCDLDCVMCSGQQHETVTHLMIECPFAHNIWDKVSMAANIVPLTSNSSIQNSWTRAQPQSKVARKKWMIWISATCWHLWKERNSRIFEGRNFVATDLWPLDNNL